jgi:pilus assembly protein CpaE
VQIPSSRAVSASINRGVAIALDEPGHAVSQAIRQLADLVIERSPANGRGPLAPEAPRKGRTLSLLRRGGGR